jgi:hypothetical protein
MHIEMVMYVQAVTDRLDSELSTQPPILEQRNVFGAWV